MLDRLFKLSVSAMLLALLGSLLGCGQKGPLTLPPAPAPSATQPPPAASAASVPAR